MLQCDDFLMIAFSQYNKSIGFIEIDKPDNNGSNNTSSSSSSSSSPFNTQKQLAQEPQVLLGRVYCKDGI
jgi:hypothetical protein